jgi:hypothetical protein
MTIQNTGNSFVQGKLDVPARTSKACCTIESNTQIAIAVQLLL